MDNRTCVDRQTYLLILSNQREYYTRTGIANPDLRARQTIAAAFVCNEALLDEDFQKDYDDAQRNRDWTA